MERVENAFKGKGGDARTGIGHRHLGHAGLRHPQRHLDLALMPPVREFVDGERRRGVGTRLLAALVAEAERSALPALSLSVEPDNPAARLYERLGFRTVGVNGGSLTMLLDLSKA